MGVNITLVAAAGIMLGNGQNTAIMHTAGHGNSQFGNLILIGTEAALAAIAHIYNRIANSIVTHLSGGDTHSFTKGIGMLLGTCAADCIVLTDLVLTDTAFRVGDDQNRIVRKGFYLGDLLFGIIETLLDPNRE